MPPQERSSQPSCMFDEVRNKRLLRQLGTRLAIERANAETLRLRAPWRNTESNKGCEVKRRTLNLVVSPVMF